MRSNLTSQQFVNSVAAKRHKVGSKPVDDKEAFEIATRVAFRAGRLARARLGDPEYLKWKGLRDVVSGSVMDVQALIVSSLQAECPGDSILAEEGPDDEPLDANAERLWIVDPICGSLNYVHGIPFFAISIALRVGGQLRVGVVHNPVAEETFAARIGEVATLNGRPITAATVALGPEFWEQALIATDLPHSGMRRDQAMQIFRLFAGEVQAQHIMGSPALGLCYVAAGRLHAYWNLEANPWDVAAACVILEQAGALVSDAEGGSWHLSTGSYVAANPASHTWALRGTKTILGRGAGLS